MAVGYGSTPSPSGTINFGSVVKGVTLTLPTALTVSETGDATLTVSGITITGTHAADFVLDETVPFSIVDGGAAVEVGIKFRPRAVGARSATLTVTHNAAGSPATYTLSGTGTAPAAAVNGVITNDLVDSAAVDVAAPYGPLVRVTNMASLPSPNRDYVIELTDTRGVKVFATYEQLKDAQAIDRQVALAEGLNYRLHDLIGDVETINTALQAIKLAAGGPYTQANWDDAIDLLRSLNWVSGFN